MRRGQIIRLLSSRDDHLPTLAARPLSAAGFVHRAVVREECPDCLTNGRRMPGCETCGGRGYLERRRRRDPYDTGQSLGHFAESSARHEAGRERDREIVRLGVQVAPPRPAAELAVGVRPEGWEVARAVAWAVFDYGALDVALEELRGVDDGAYHAVMSVHVYAWQLEPGPSELARLERGLVVLAALLPDPLRAPAAVSLAPGKVRSVLGRGDRDQQIRRLVRDGAAAQWVAREFGLSVSQVHRIAANGRGAA